MTIFNGYGLHAHVKSYEHILNRVTILLTLINTDTDTYTHNMKAIGWYKTSGQIPDWTMYAQINVQSNALWKAVDTQDTHMLAK